MIEAGKVYLYNTPVGVDLPVYAVDCVAIDAEYDEYTWLMYSQHKLFILKADSSKAPYRWGYIVCKYCSIPAADEAIKEAISNEVECIKVKYK